MRLRRGLGATVLLALTWSPLTAQAGLTSAEAPARNPAQRTSVEISLCAGQDEAQLLERVLRDVLESFQLAATLRGEACPNLVAVVGEGPGPSDALARIFIDARGKVAKLYLVDERSGNVLVRKVPRRGLAGQVVHEQLAEIVRASLDTLLEGGSVGVRPANMSSAPSRQPAPGPDAREGRSVSELELGLGLYYAASSYASGALLHGPGIFAEVASAPRALSWAVGASAEYRFLDHSEPSVHLHLDVLPLRLFAGVSAPLGPGRLQLGLGAGTDLIRIAPGAAELSDDVADSRWLASAVFRAQARLAARVSASVNLFSLVALDADPSATRYVVTLDGQTRVFLSPWALRPSIGLGLSL